MMFHLKIQANKKSILNSDRMVDLVSHIASKNIESDMLKIPESKPFRDLIKFSIPVITGDFLIKHIGSDDNERWKTMGDLFDHSKDFEEAILNHFKYYLFDSNSFKVVHKSYRIYPQHYNKNFDDITIKIYKDEWPDFIQWIKQQSITKALSDSIMKHIRDSLIGPDGFSIEEFKKFEQNNIFPFSEIDIGEIYQKLTQRLDPKK